MSACEHPHDSMRLMVSPYGDMSIYCLGCHREVHGHHAEFVRLLALSKFRDEFTDTRERLRRLFDMEEEATG